MAEMELRIETPESTRAKIAEKMGLDRPSAFDLVDRSRYADDESYLDAVIKADMERNNPEYQAARRRLKMEYRERMEQAQRTEQEAAYKEIRSTVQLDGLDQREIDTQAAEMARRDLAAGRISASGLGKAIEDYAKQLTEKRKDTKASNQLFNAMLRGQR